MGGVSHCYSAAVIIIENAYLSTGYDWRKFFGMDEKSAFRTRRDNAPNAVVRSTYCQKRKIRSKAHKFAQTSNFDKILTPHGRDQRWTTWTHQTQAV